MPLLSEFHFFFSFSFPMIPSYFTNLFHYPFCIVASEEKFQLEVKRAEIQRKVEEALLERQEQKVEKARIEREDRE